MTRPQLCVGGQQILFYPVCARRGWRRREMLAVNFEFGQRPLQLLHAGVSDARTSEIDRFQMVQAFKRCQVGVGDQGIWEDEQLELPGLIER